MCKSLNIIVLYVGERDLSVLAGSESCYRVGYTPSRSDSLGTISSRGKNELLTAAAENTLLRFVLLYATWPISPRNYVITGVYSTYSAA